MSEKKITTIKKEFSEQLFTGEHWSSGIYYLQLLDEKGKQVTNGIVLIQ